MLSFKKFLFENIQNLIETKFFNPTINQLKHLTLHSKNGGVRFAIDKDNNLWAGDAHDYIHNDFGDGTRYQNDRNHIITGFAVRNHENKVFFDYRSNDYTTKMYRPNHPIIEKMKKFGMIHDTASHIYEGANMHHGSANAPQKLEPKNPTRQSYQLLDTLIGTHYAADPKVSKTFVDGNYGRKPENPATFTARRPPRSQLVKVHGKGWDQTNVAKHVVKTVFEKDTPENKRMFVLWAQESRRVTPTTAEAWYNKLSKGQDTGDPFHHSGNQKPSVANFITRHDPGMHGGGMKVVIADKYVDIMKSKGKSGIVYQNTSPNETKDVQSKKSYIIFDPSKLPHTRS